MMHSNQVYTEVYEILKVLDKQLVMKIPQEILQTIVNHVDETYEVKIDWNLPLEEQSLHEDTFNVLGWLNLNFWVEGEEKEYYQQKYLQNIIDHESNQQLVKQSLWKTIFAKMKKK